MTRPTHPPDADDAPDAPAALPPDAAAKLKHVCTAADPLVREMIRSFQEAAPGTGDRAGAAVHVLDTRDVAPLDAVVAVGGSFSSLPNPLAPQKVLGYIKVAAAHVAVEDLARLKAPVVNPDAIRRVLSGDADTQAAVLPLGNVRIPGRSLFDSLRHAIAATFEHFHGGALYDTLEYLVSYGWDDAAEPWRHGSKNHPHLLCPFCDERVYFPRRRRAFRCNACHADLTLLDYLGLLTDANESTSDSAVAMNLKAVLEHLTLLTLLRRLVERGAGLPGRVLLLRDGPLLLRGQQARLVDPIRGYLRYLADSGVPVFLAGIEREGAFASHRAQIELEGWLKELDGVFVPDNRYVLERIKHAGGASAVYGKKGLYGSKAFCRIDERNVLVLSVPNRRNDFDAYAADPKPDDLIGFAPTLATLKQLISRHFPGVPLPLVAVERLCALPQYPTADLLRRMEDRYVPL